MKYLILLALLTGCQEVQEVRTNKNAPDGFGRFYDKETGIICYTYYQHAMSCIKLDNN